MISNRWQVPPRSQNNLPPFTVNAGIGMRDDSGVEERDRVDESAIPVRNFSFRRLDAHAIAHESNTMERKEWNVRARRTGWFLG